jgi:nitrate/TMAO reductase-like tetraheme cytochrome c subunit
MSFVKGKRAIWLAAAGGLAVGVVLVVLADWVDPKISSQEFCTGACHSMQVHVAGKDYYQQSVHRSTHTGVVTGCGDCHIPNELVPATWVHVKKGLADIYATLVRDLDSPEAWAARRPALTEEARHWFLETDSATCRHCHRKDAIEPRSQAGRTMHGIARQKGMTCIECHTNLVHPPAGS